MDNKEEEDPLCAPGFSNASNNNYHLFCPDKNTFKG